MTGAGGPGPDPEPNPVPNPGPDPGADPGYDPQTDPDVLEELEPLVAQTGFVSAKAKTAFNSASELLHQCDHFGCVLRTFNQ